MSKYGKKFLWPEQLLNPEFRFFKVRENDKRPRERSWNKDNCYPYTAEVLDEHLRHGGNLGVLTGPGNLIVLDFDDIKFYNKYVDRLPITFTVQTAGKRLFHMYYILRGEMFKKIAIMDEDKNTFMDIQALRSGIVGPGSKINRRYYNVVNDKPIATINMEYLVSLFNIKPKFKGKGNEQYISTKAHPDEIEKAFKIMGVLGMDRVSDKHFKCPFHDSVGGSSLFLGESGSLYCFHCHGYWHDVYDFAQKFCDLKQDECLRYTIEVIEDVSE